MELIQIIYILILYLIQKFLYLRCKKYGKNQIKIFLIKHFSKKRFGKEDSFLIKEVLTIKYNYISNLRNHLPWDNRLEREYLDNILYIIENTLPYFFFLKIYCGLLILNDILFLIKSLNIYLKKKNKIYYILFFFSIILFILILILQIIKIENFIYSYIIVLYYYNIYIYTKYIILRDNKIFINRFFNMPPTSLYIWILKYFFDKKYN